MDEEEAFARVFEQRLVVVEMFCFNKKHTKRVKYFQSRSFHVPSRTNRT